MQRYRSLRAGGFTLVELVLTIALVSIFAGMAIPLVRNSIQREREIELRRALREIRVAIDKYKEASDRGFIQVKLGTEGYPDKLETLVEGVPLNGAVDKKLKLLRRIPVDPMTNSTNWGLRAYQDDANSLSWGGQNVFDVFTRSGGTGLDGTKYRDW